MMLRTDAASRSGDVAAGSMKCGRGERGRSGGLPFYETSKPVCDVRFAVNTWKRKPHLARPAFRMGAALLPGQGRSDVCHADNAGLFP